MIVKKLLLVIIINLLLLELLSFSLIYAVGVIHPDWRLDLRIEKVLSSIDQDYLERVLLKRDLLLGWDRTPGDIQTRVNVDGNQYIMSYGADGARNDVNYHDEVLIASYGDSFTDCAEVNDNETWQYYIEELIHKDVKNYGVSGYGVGQTWLKLKRHLEEGRIEKVTIFAIYENGLDRVVNNYRPFQFWRTRGKLGFKPSYRYISGEVTFIPNPWIQSIKTLEQLQKLALVSAKTDYWASRQIMLNLEFPYMLQSIKAIHSALRIASTKMVDSGGHVSMWDTKEGQMIMEYILKEFVTYTKANNSIPIILFIPQVSQHWSSGRKQPEYYEFKKHFRNKHINDVTVLDVYDAEFDEKRFNVMPFKGHASAYGNQAIAKYITDSLADIGLLP